MTSSPQEKLEHIQQIPLSELHAFEGHPFRVVDDEEMQKVVDSVKEFGILTPLIARPDPYGGYEIISGHRRLHASELAGLESVPVIVREMDDDEAIICMVDANLQRENSDEVGCDEASRRQKRTGWNFPTSCRKVGSGCFDRAEHRREWKNNPKIYSPNRASTRTARYGRC